MTDNYMPIEKYYCLKSVLEKVWGRDTYLELKHCSNLKVWKKYCSRTLQATKMSVFDTVLIADTDWYEDLSSIIQSGLNRVKCAKCFDKLFQGLAGTYIEISFHQIGSVPKLSLRHRRQIKKGRWRLDGYRSVQYVQSVEQQEVLASAKRKLAKKGIVAKNHQKVRE